MNIAIRACTIFLATVTGALVASASSPSVVEHPAGPHTTRTPADFEARGAGEATIAAVQALYEGVYAIVDETPDAAAARARLERLGDELVRELRARRAARSMPTSPRSPMRSAP